MIYPQYDVIVVGSGAAGLYGALCLPDNLQVALVTKDRLNTGASDWAQGGIAAAISSEDSPKLHLDDTLKAGAGLCDREALQFLVDHAVTSIASLVEMGVAFDRHQSQLAMTLEAAHSRPRVLHAADTTGRAIVATLAQQVLQRSNIQVLSQAFALGLWLDSDSECRGIRKQLPDLMWQCAGTNRTASVMEEAIATVTGWRSQMHDLSLYQYVAGLSPAQQFKLPNSTAESQLKLYAETLNLLDIGYLIFKSAAFRTESRGGHYREDYPLTATDWQEHTVIEDDQWRLED